MRSIGTLSTLLKVADPLVIGATALLSYWLRFEDPETPAIYQAVVLAAFGLSVVVFAVTDVYRGRPDEGLRRNLVHLFGGWAGVILAIVLLMYASQIGSLVSRQWLAVWSVMALMGLIAMRIAAVAVLHVLQRRGLFTRRVAIAGAGELGRQVARKLEASPTAGLRVVAFYDDDPALAAATVEGAPVRGNVERIRDDVRDGGIDQVWIALPLRAEERVHRIIDDLAPFNAEVRFVPDIFGFQLLNHSITEVGGLPVIKLTESPLSGGKGLLKWIEDKLVAAAVLLVIAPLLAAIAVGIKLTSPGPVIFKQRRGGLDNREITVWKFRTMHVHDERTAGDKPQATKDDPRITRFGAFLRRTSLDELPQFINVLLGDMSVVGPRPHPLWLNDFYAGRIPTYLLRSWIKPGITGWAQVNGWRGETDEDWKMEMRVQHDLWYIEHWSLGLDLYIILMTVFRMRGERAY
jgi:putative colanic acid biosynthesis UDP-glucose lipid carrier transferase